MSHSDEQINPLFLPTGQIAILLAHQLSNLKILKKRLILPFVEKFVQITNILNQHLIAKTGFL